jgi:hypothetical protein
MSSEIKKIWIDNTSVYIQTIDDKIFSEAFDNYSRLKNATQKQRSEFEYNEVGIRWNEIDEDLCFEGFMNKPIKEYVCSV